MARLAAKALVILLLTCAAPALFSVALAKEEQAIRNVPRISIDELKALMEKHAVLVIDVRTPEDCQKGRIRGG
jgi:hypothetical protein